ncbi:helix-turn-helix transcriptional regulator [Streptomyces sp. NPDC014995]|uniref:helix-turn-helix transcriptional regulator n=1 Tax=Streptomyces sp. NPDC014995 TaxID=3364936 RepID=UPI0036FAE8E5
MSRVVTVEQFLEQLHEEVGLPGGHPEPHQTLATRTGRHRPATRTGRHRPVRQLPPRRRGDHRDRPAPRDLPRPGRLDLPPHATCRGPGHLDLPPYATCRGPGHLDLWRCPLTPLLTDEIGRDEPGQEVVLDRLLDLLVIAALRAWFSRPEAEAPAWYRATADPVVGRVLRLVQDDPAHPWTVASLAAKAGVSRAGLARRFTALMGEPPMTHLTGWRLALAADLLRDTDHTIGAIARQVGYGSAFALSSAFTRAYGVSPQEHRTTGAA